MSSIFSNQDIDYDYTNTVPFFGEEYYITKDARTADMDLLCKEAFQVTPMISILFFACKLPSFLNYIKCTVLSVLCRLL